MKAQRWLLVLLLIFCLTAFMVGGCGNDDIGDTDPESNGDENGEPGEIDDVDEYVPEVAVPDGLPVYPGAEIEYDMPTEEGRWQWHYSTTGSGNDILAFFVGALQELGFSINSDRTIAFREEFFTITDDEIVRVYWLDSDNLAEIDDVTADTPNRWYTIDVHLDSWAAR